MAIPIGRSGAYMARLILLNKPFRVLSQFTDSSGRATLADHVPVPGVYPAGRLDWDSEGLLLLTDDGGLQARISSPRFRLPKTYLVQVEGIPTQARLQQLRRGVVLKDGLTRPAEAELIPAPALWSRDPPVRERKTVADCWLKLVISEGRNRQVRRMTAAIGHPTLRLVRWQIGDWTLAGLAPGEYREIVVAREEIPHRESRPGTKPPGGSRNRGGSRNGRDSRDSRDGRDGQDREKRDREKRGKARYQAPAASAPGNGSGGNAGPGRRARDAAAKRDALPPGTRRRRPAR